MCGVLGIVLKNPGEQEFNLVRQLFVQSMIRGKHASGVSYVKNNKVYTFKEPVDACTFINNQDISSWINEDGNLYCIGHVRYSTSDLAYNQPMATDDLSIVHNGVISQESPESWKETFGYDTETRNDVPCINPLNSGITADMAEEAPVVCGMILFNKLILFKELAIILRCFLISIWICLLVIDYLMI